MTTRNLLSICAALAALIMVAACAGTAPQLTAAPQYKYSTPLPQGIAVPDRVETSIGSLNLNYGYPDDATTQKVYDNLDASRALQAYLLAIPTQTGLFKDTLFQHQTN